MEISLASFLFFSLFGVAIGKTDFPNEIIATSADVVNGEIKNIGKAGESYRLYAIYAIGSDDILVKQVSITDSSGKKFNLNDLCGKEGSKFLNESNIVVGPVSVSDSTPLKQNRKRSVAFRLTYTIYLVSTKVPTLPVVDIIQSYPYMFINSDNYNGQETRGLTILSADGHFSMRKFHFTAESTYIIPRGYDVQSSNAKESVIDLTQQNAYSSYITIFGPVVTILNKDQTKTGRFSIGYDPASTSGDLDAGASLTLLSPNWLSLDNSYSTSFVSFSEAFDRQFKYPQDTDMKMSISAASLKFGDSITIETKSSNGKVTQFGYNLPDKSEMTVSASGNSLHLKAIVVPLDSPDTYPRFIIKVTTPAAAPTTDKVTATTGKMETTTSVVECASITTLVASIVFIFLF